MTHSPFFFKQWGGVRKKRAGRVLEDIGGPGSIRAYQMRFLAPVHVGDRLTVTVRHVPDKDRDETTTQVEVLVTDAGGAEKARGTAQLRPYLPERQEAAST